MRLAITCILVVVVVAFALILSAPRVGAHDAVCVPQATFIERAKAAGMERVREIVIPESSVVIVVIRFQGAIVGYALVNEPTIGPCLVVPSIYLGLEKPVDTGTPT